MASKKTKFSAFTQNAIESPKAMLIVSTFIAIIIDIIATIILFYLNYELQYVIVPTAMVVLDVIYALMAMNSNYRYKYTILQFISYIVLVIVGIVGIALIGGTFSNNVIMTTISLVIWIASHVMVCVSTIVTSLHAAKVNKSSSGLSSVISIGLLSLFAVITISSLFSNGFFGQGFIEENKTIVYEYVEEKDCYSVKSTLRGRGNSITVPNTFNGKDVLYFDAKVLEDTSLRVVRFEKREKEISFVNFEMIDKYYTEGLSLYADKEDIFTMRDALIALKNQNDTLNQNLADLISNFYPTGLNNDEVYITFKYSFDDFKFVDGNVYDIWIGKKGDVFYTDHDASLDYTQYYSAKDPDHLNWNYLNNNKYIMDELLDDEGNPIHGRSIQNNIKDVKVSFDKIYTVSFSEDNDEKYAYYDNQNVVTELGDGTVLDYLYVTTSSCEDLLDEAPTRKGFELKWYDDDNKPITSISDLFVKYDNTNTINIYPEWTLNAPVINSLTTNNSNNTFTYGDNITFSVDATSEADGIIYSYKWDGNDGLNTYAINNALPSMSGDHTVEVTAYSETTTSLTSSSTETIQVTINKKALHFNFEPNSDLVYDGQNKTISCNYDDTDVINDDVIEYDYNYQEVINAGKYTFSVNLTGDTDQKYFIASESSYTFTIEKRSITLNWQSEREFVYNSANQSIKVVSIDNEVEGEEDLILSNISYSGTQKNAGSHQMTASISLDNYVIENGSTQGYTITKAPLTIRFDDVEFVYSGRAVDKSKYENAYVIDSNNKLQGDDKITDVLEFKFNGEAVSAKDVGIYGLEVDYTLKTLGNNYSIEIYGSNLTITKKDITLNWQSNTSLEYNGKEQGVYITSIDGAVNGEVNTILSHLTYNGKATDVGNYTMDVSITEGTSSYNNYYLTSNTNTSMNYEITKAKLTIKLNDVQKTYDGEIYEEFKYVVSGLKGSDKLEDVLTLYFYGDALDAVDVGKYDIDIKYNLNSKGNNYTISVEVGTLTINARNVTLIWDGNTSFTYDGNAHSPVVVDAENLVEGDSVEDLNLIYSGNNEINAGNYTVTATCRNSNYNVTSSSSSCKYSISTATLTINISDVTYDADGTSNYTLEYSISGLVEGEKESDVIEVSLYIEGNVENPTEAGEYVINANVNLLSQNYTYNIVKGTLTINDVVENQIINNFGLIIDVRVKQMMNKIFGGSNYALF